MLGEHAQAETRPMLVIADAVLGTRQTSPGIDERCEQVGLPH